MKSLIGVLSLCSILSAQVNGYYLVDEMEMTFAQGTSDIYYPGSSVQSIPIPTPGPLISTLPLPVIIGGNPLLRAASNYQIYTTISDNVSNYTTQLVPGSSTHEGDTQVYYLNFVDQREFASSYINIKHKANNLSSPNIRFHTYLTGYLRIKTSSISDYNALISTSIASKLDGLIGQTWTTIPQSNGYVHTSISLDQGLTWSNMDNSVGGHSDNTKNYPEISVVLKANTNNYIYFIIDIDSEAIKSSFINYTSSVENFTLLFNILPNYTPSLPLNITWNMPEVTTQYNECSPSLFIERSIFGLSYSSNNIKVRGRLTNSDVLGNYAAFLLFDSSKNNSLPCAFNLNFNSLVTMYIPNNVNDNTFYYTFNQPNGYRGLYVQWALLDLSNPYNILFSNLLEW